MQAAQRSRASTDAGDDGTTLRRLPPRGLWAFVAVNTPPQVMRCHKRKNAEHTPSFRTSYAGVLLLAVQEVKKVGVID